LFHYAFEFLEMIDSRSMAIYPHKVYILYLTISSHLLLKIILSSSQAIVPNHINLKILLVFALLFECLCAYALINFMISKCLSYKLVTVGTVSHQINIKAFGLAKT